MAEVSDYTALLSGGGWSGVNYSQDRPAFVTYSFETTVQSYLTTADFTQDFLDSFQAFNEAEKTAARNALAQWADASGLVFLEVGAGEGDIRFGSHDFSLDPNTSGAGGVGFYGYSYVDEFVAYRSPIGGDVFINAGEAEDIPLLLHETGHAIGLKHPDEGDPTLAAALDDRSQTVMSYNGTASNVLGPLDLQAAEHVYGDALSDGTQVQSWAWNSTSRVLTQVGFSTDDVIFGVSVRDIINGGNGNDRIGGFEGNDDLTGGDGDDNIFGNEGDDVLIGGLGNDYLVGGDGIDTVSYFYTLGGAPSTVGVTVDLSANSGSGPGGADTDALFEFENIVGSARDDDLTGNDHANVIDGRTGADVMAGLLGNDIYYVDNAGDVVEETASGGNDKVYASVSHTLGATAEVEILLARVASASTTLNLTGSSIAQRITGNDGMNLIDGRGGADTMIGLAGHDSYYVDNVNDVVQEAVGGGNDNVFTSVSYVLAATTEVEQLATRDSAGTTALNLYGNGFAQSINGNTGNNIIDGRGGADTMTGFGGDDKYYVDHSGDEVREAVGGGSDKVYTSVDHVLAANSEVEVLLARDAAATTNLNLYGNAFGQRITGNAGNNILDGKAGADTLIGLDGNDRYYVDNAADIVQEAVGGGSDKVYASVSYVLGAAAEVESLWSRDGASTVALNLTGNSFGQSIYGNAGMNVIYGKGGNDTLIGLAGADNFIFDTALGAGNVDTLTDFSHVDDTIRLDDAIFTSLTAGAYLAANQFHVGAAAADAFDRIIYNNVTGDLSFDADGDGAGAAQLFAQLAAGLALQINDFYVV